MMHIEIIQQTDGIEQVNASILNKMYELAFEDTSEGITSQLDNTSTFEGRLHSAYGYEEKANYLQNKYNNLYITIDTKYVYFKDQVVEQTLLSKNYGDGVGITQQQLAAIQSLDDRMFADSTITSFNEFKYFLGVNNIPWRCFSGCQYLKYIDIPDNITHISQYAFEHTDALESFGRHTQNGITTLSGITNLNSECFQYTGYSGQLLFPDLRDLNVQSYGAWFCNSPNITKLLFGHVGTVQSGSQWSSSSRCGFYGCSSLRTLDLGDSLSKWDVKNFGQMMPALEAVVIRVSTPPEVYDGGTKIDSTNISDLWASWIGNNSCKVFVPNAAAVTAYQADDVWGTISSRIFPISDYETGVSNGTYL